MAAVSRAACTAVARHLPRARQGMGPRPWHGSVGSARLLAPGMDQQPDPRSLLRRHDDGHARPERRAAGAAAPRGRRRRDRRVRAQRAHDERRAGRISTALRAQPQSDGTYLVQSGPGCAGPWTPLTTAPSVDFRGDPSSITTTGRNGVARGVRGRRHDALLPRKPPCRPRCERRITRGQRRAARHLRARRGASRGLGGLG